MGSHIPSVAQWATSYAQLENVTAHTHATLLSTTSGLVSVLVSVGALQSGHSMMRASTIRSHRCNNETHATLHQPGARAWLVGEPQSPWFATNGAVSSTIGLPTHTHTTVYRIVHVKDRELERLIMMYQCLYHTHIGQLACAHKVAFSQYHATGIELTSTCYNLNAPHGCIPCVQLGVPWVA